MGWSFLVLSVIGICLLIWIVVEFKRMKHKFLAIFFILLILFFYFSAALVFKGSGVDLKTPSGWAKASGIYLVWLGKAFDNVKVITTNAVKMEWNGNQTHQPLSEKK